MLQYYFMKQMAQFTKNAYTREQAASQGKREKGADFKCTVCKSFVIILFYLSASSSTIISTVCRLNDGVLCK